MPLLRLEGGLGANLAAVVIVRSEELIYELYVVFRAFMCIMERWKFVFMFLFSPKPGYKHACIRIYYRTLADIVVMVGPSAIDKKKKKNYNE